jgi:hypothetical protein
MGEIACWPGRNEIDGNLSMSDALSDLSGWEGIKAPKVVV